MHNRILFSLALHSSVRQFQMPFEGLSFVNTLVKFGIIYATGPLLQNKTKIVCLRWITFNSFNYKPLWTMLNYLCQLIKIRVVFHTLYIWNEDGDPHFFAFLEQVTHYLTAEKILKKSIEWKIFARTSLNATWTGNVPGWHTLFQLHSIHS